MWKQRQTFARRWRRRLSSPRSGVRISPRGHTDTGTHAALAAPRAARTRPPPPRRPRTPAVPLRRLSPGRGQVLLRFRLRASNGSLPDTGSRPGRRVRGRPGPWPRRRRAGPEEGRVLFPEQPRHLLRCWRQGTCRGGGERW